MSVKTLSFKSKESERVFQAFLKVGPDEDGAVCVMFLEDVLGASCRQLLEVAREDWLEDVPQAPEEVGECYPWVRIRPGALEGALDGGVLVSVVR